jgi:hypothetical protein
MAIGQGKLFKRDPLPLPYGGRVVQPSVSLHAGICKGVRVVEGDELLEKQQGLKKLKAAVVLDGRSISL